MMTKADDKAKNTPGGASNYFNNPRCGGITVVDDNELPQRRKSGCCGGGGGNNIIEGQPDPTAVQ